MSGRNAGRKIRGVRSGLPAPQQSAAAIELDYPSVRPPHSARADFADVAVPVGGDALRFIIVARSELPAPQPRAFAVELDHPRVGAPLVGTAQRAASAARDKDVAVHVGRNALRRIRDARSELPGPQLVAVAVELDRPGISVPLVGAAERTFGIAHNIDVAVHVGRNATRKIDGARSGLSAPQPMAVAVELDHPRVEAPLGGR